MVLKVSVLLAFLFISCAEQQQVPVSFPQDYMEPAHMDVSYAGVVLRAGEEFPIYVKVMDKDKNPLPSVMVKVTLDGPAVAYFAENHVATDATGTAKFDVRGTGLPSWPTPVTVTFTAGKISSGIEVYGPPR